MAILVVIDHDNSHVDAQKNQRGSYKRGDIVAVHEDNAHDGDLASNPVMPPWYLVKIAGVSAAQVRHILEPEVSAVAFDERGEPLRIRRRLFRLNVTDIPAGARARLLADRYIEVTAAQARNFIRNKITNEPF